MFQKSIYEKKFYNFWELNKFFNNFSISFLLPNNLVNYRKLIKHFTPWIIHPPFFVYFCTSPSHVHSHHMKFSLTLYMKSSNQFISLFFFCCVSCCLLLKGFGCKIGHEEVSSILNCEHIFIFLDFWLNFSNFFYCFRVVTFFLHSSLIFILLFSWYRIKTHRAHIKKWEEIRHFLDCYSPRERERLLRVHRVIISIDPI